MYGGENGMILFSVKISSKHQQRLQAEFENQTFVFANNKEEMVHDLSEVEIFVTYGNDVTEEFIHKASNLKWVMVLSAGVEELPFDLLKDKGILVTNSRGIHKVQMAEYAISMLLQVCRQEKTLIQNEQDKIWDKRLKLQEITGKTMLITGTGAIGQEVARLAKAFHMKTIGVSRSGHKKDYFDETYTNDNLKKVLPQVDFLVSILPSTTETKGYFDYSHFELMPEHSIFLNMGRGDAVSSDTILKAVRNDEIAHAVLDVFEEEPLPENHPFWEEEKITVTPHISGTSPNYIQRALEIFTKNLENYLEGKNEYINKIDFAKGY